MKKIMPSILLLIALTALLLTACSGDLAVDSLTVTGGLPTQFELNEKPDFSKVTAVATYNDGTTATLTAKDLVFGPLDTSIEGSHNLTIAYGDFEIVVTVRVKGGSALEEGQDVTAVSFPDSLVLWELNKKDFINKDRGYIVGDDNPFDFTLNLTVYSKDDEMLDVTEYISVSAVYLQDSDTPLVGDELAKYVVIDEVENSFDFTEEAIGMSFTIKSRPGLVKPGTEDEMTKSLDVTIVDGYNIYEAFELNYLTNHDTAFDFTGVDSGETRTHGEIIDDFLVNEKNSVPRPQGIVGIVLHGDLTIERTDIPREYFYNKDRKNDLYEDLSIYDVITTEENKSYSIHGNYFTIYSDKLPGVVEEGVGNQTNKASNSSLFRFTSDVSRDKNFDHTQYSVNISDLKLMDNDPQNNSTEANEKALLGIIAIKTFDQVTNFDNVNIQAFFVAVLAREDYQTINVNECIFENSWMNHFLLVSFNPIQDDDEEPIAKDLYPRLTLNINKSNISRSGGPAIIMNTENVEFNKNKHSGPSVNISADSNIESWVTGNEAWFQTIGLTSIVDLIKVFDKDLAKINSTFSKEEILTVNGTPTSFKYMNIIAVNLTVPDVSQSVTEIFAMLQGKIDVDGKLTIGGNTILDMDDSSSGGYGDQTISGIKKEDSGNHVLATPTGNISAIGTDYSKLQSIKGDISANTDKDFLTIYFFSIGLVFGDYHPVKAN